MILAHHHAQSRTAARSTRSRNAAHDRRILLQRGLNAAGVEGNGPTRPNGFPGRRFPNSPRTGLDAGPRAMAGKRRRA